MRLNNILLAHFKTKLTVILHGSSGYGKSASIYSFAKDNGFQVLEKRTCYVDPIEVILPVKNDEDRLVDFWPSRWLHDLTSLDCPPTILFLDEFNRPASSQTFSMFTELLLDRSINGIKISDNVLLVGACNLSGEDTGVVDIPDAVMNRATHISFVPDDMEIISNMRSRLAQEALKVAPKIVAKPSVPQLNMRNCPRQIDAVCALFEVEREKGVPLLTDEELGIVSRGRIGLEPGNLLAGTLLAIHKKVKFKLPSTVTPKTFEQIAECEEEGMALEVITLLKDQMAADTKNARNIADYLLRYATPETCRALKEAGLNYNYPKNEHPVDREGKPFVHADPKKNGELVTKLGEPWPMYALRIGKLAMKTKFN